MMRQHITTGLEVSGFAAITAGVALAFGVGIALIAGGAFLVLTGYLVGARA